MKMDAECNETTPVISFNQFHKDFNMFIKNDIKILHLQLQQQLAASMRSMEMRSTLQKTESARNHEKININEVLEMLIWI